MKKRRLTQQSTAGFTLLEVLAVVIIIGVLMAIAAPGWVAFMNRQRANSARDQVLQSLRATQAEAKRQRRRRVIEFLNSNDSESGIPEIEQNGIVQVLGEGEIVPGNIELEASDSEGNDVSVLAFREDGTLSVEVNDYDDLGATPPDLPVSISIEAPPGSGNERCVVIDTILGSMYSGSDDECDLN